MEEGYYDVMQVCENGHQITSLARSAPELTERYCRRCGAKTITACPKCNRNVRGYSEGYMSTTGLPVPAFCHACGQPYPWTEKKLAAARELAEEIEGLNLEEVETLKGSLDDLIRETPKTPVAAVRFRKLLAKAGAHTAQTFRDILVDIVSEAAKKAIWPD